MEIGEKDFTTVRKGTLVRDDVDVIPKNVEN